MAPWHDGARGVALALGTAMLLAGAAPVPVLAQEQRNLMDFADRDHDGMVTPEEYEAFSLIAWDRAMGGRKKVLFDELDEPLRMRYGQVPKDTDGYISKKEFIDTIPSRFNLLDANGDGVLDDAEMNTYNR